MKVSLRSRLSLVVFIFSTVDAEPFPSGFTVNIHIRRKTGMLAKLGQVGIDFFFFFIPLGSFCIYFGHWKSFSRLVLIQLKRSSHICRFTHAPCIQKLVYDWFFLRSLDKAVDICHPQPTAQSSRHNRINPPGSEEKLATINENRAQKLGTCVY